MKLSIVIPCYNESEVIGALYDRVRVQMDAVSACELVLVDDGSSDSTWADIQALCAKDARVVGVKLSRNFGQQYAQSCGLDHARGERIVILDADLQDPPELIPDMMRVMDEGADVVYGKRAHRKGETWFKLFTAHWFYKILDGLSDVTIPRNTCDFRMMNRRVLERLQAMPERVRFQRGLVAWLGFKQVALEYDRDARFAGTTHYSLFAMLRLAESGIVSFSSQPLRFAFWLGACAAVAGGLLMVYVVLSYLFFEPVGGWTSMVAIMLIFQALQFIILGILGSYLGVIFHEVKGRPLYLVDTVVRA